MNREELDIDIEAVRRLADLVDRHNLTELTVEAGEVSIYMAREAASEANVPEAMVTHLVEAPKTSEEPMGAPLISPAVGVFYRASAPDVPPFVREGDEIEEGQPVGIIEAMKTFSDIPAPFGGRVRKIVAQNGQLVNIGDTLMFVDTEDEGGA